MDKVGGNSWRVIEDGLCDGRESMAVDLALLRACEEGKAPPTLRLYGWKTPTLTIGYSQNENSGIDIPRCERLGIPVVRRPTGGRAVLHHEELTYSITAPVGHPNFPHSLKGTLKAVGEILLFCLKEMGISDAAMADKANGASFQRKSPACFALRNHFEITVNNKKLAGSAQRRTKKAFLQHGSILIGHDPGRINSLLRFNDASERGQNEEILRRSTTTLREVLGRQLEFNDASRIFCEGFNKFFPNRCFPGVLSMWEMSLRNDIIRYGDNAQT